MIRPRHQLRPEHHGSVLRPSRPGRLSRLYHRPFAISCWPSAIRFSLILLAAAGQVLHTGTCAAAEPVLKYGTGDWPVPGLGNVRVRLAVTNKADAVWAHVPWRRRDDKPETKDTILVDAATGARVTNLIRVNISREVGDLLFQPLTVPGEYYLYYLPYRTAGSWYFPTTVYLAPTNTAAGLWQSDCAPVAQLIRDGQIPAIPKAQVLEIQAINDFHRFDPMEVTATPGEMREFLNAFGSRPYLLFAEDRSRPIRMTDALPQHWVRAGPSSAVTGQACRGEFYAFQVGLYALQTPIENVTVSFTDLQAGARETIPAAACRCFNLAGTNWLGQPFQKVVSVPKGRLQALWFGVAVPRDASAQTYRGRLTFAASNAPAVSLNIQLRVTNQELADAGDSEIWRQSRLRWLDSSIGEDDEVFAPYTPVGLQGHRASVLGRAVHFNDVGLLDSITSTFTRNIDAADAPPRELLAAPMAFIAQGASGNLDWVAGSTRILEQTSGALSWEAISTAGALELQCRAKMECDGYINFKLTLHAGRATELKDLRLEIPLRKEAAVYMMGLGRKGGYRPASWRWKWDANRSNNQLWLGDINAGLSCKLKHIVDRWDLSNLKESGPYLDWSNDGLGGCDVEEDGDRVVIRAYTGARKVAAGEDLHFNFGLLITPVKVLDKGHWGWRYFHQGTSSPIPRIAETGATIVNLHQGDALNPYINYPFLTVDQLSAYTREAHARQMKVKIYYTIRELSDYTGEFWALRSLGSEVFSDGPGFHLADHFQENKAQGLPKTGDSWLCEHVVSGYVPAWHTPLGNGRVDAAIATTGLSRWHNYYLEGLGWLIRNAGIDGLYLDGVGYDREIMKRVRKVMQRSRNGCLIDFHSGNNYHPEYGLNNCANQYLELFPYIDSLWFGEGFNYNEPPDYWLVEIAGIPYGLFGEMLQDGGNPWRGMLFGMTSRLGWGGNPRPIWQVWDEFGIQEARMSGFWDADCPVKTNCKDILATAYVRKGKTLVSVASWASSPTLARLEIDCAALGLEPSKTGLYAPPIRGFQPEAKFKLGEDLPVAPGKGWLLFVDEVEHKLSPPPDFSLGRKVLFEERFAADQLARDWTLAISKQAGTAISVATNGLAINAAANAAAFVERALPPGVTMVTCVVAAQTDQGASWGPGMALVWPNGKILRVNLRAEGRFGVDDGTQQLLEGFSKPGSACQLSVVLDEKEVAVYARQDNEACQELARLPRREFGVDPLAVRLGKMSPGGKNEDFSTLGPEGQCRIEQVQAFGPAAPATPGAK